jgi:hypothetical protein
MITKHLLHIFTTFDLWPMGDFGEWVVERHSERSEESRDADVGRWNSNLTRVRYVYANSPRWLLSLFFQHQ